jgi:DNA-binding transcriptional MerR regulator
MASRILTLFGEELVPEQLQAAPKKKKAPGAGTSKKKMGEEPLREDHIVILAGWEPDKQYYAIGEVAALFGVRTSHIRFWTNEFAIKVRTTRKGDRLYTPAHISELRAIYHLVKERGFTIPGAKAKLKEAGKVPAGTLDLKESLLQLRNQLLQIRNKLV